MDSCWAREPETLTISSVVSVFVSIFSFSNRTLTPMVDNSRRADRQSLVFRAKRDTDFTRMRSILPFRQSRIMRLKSSRWSIRVPVSPSSAYTSTSSQPSCWAISSV